MRRPILTLALLALPGAAFATGAGTKGAVNLLVPAFEGQGALGLNVATVLNLQVFRTLRKAPWPNPKKLSFGDGTVFWGEVPLAGASHAAAERAAAALPGGNVRLVLWGKASAYADGVSVEAHLTLPPADPTAPAGPEIWSVAVPGGAAGSVLSCDVPARRYSFEPIVLGRTVVETYASPRALKVFTDRTQKEVAGDLTGGAFHARESGPDGVWLSAPMPGWLPLPMIGGQRNEVAEFTSAVMRILRADWEGAAQQLQKVLALPSTPTAVQVDAWLYLGLANEKQGRSGRTEFEKAFALNPLSRPAARYVVMNAFADYARGGDREAARGRIRDRLAQTRFLFPDDDPWFRTATASLGTTTQPR